MITNLTITNFKSITKVTLPCARVNILIGEPNTGKSNILESLGLFSFAYYSRKGYDARSFIRYQQTRNLFHNEVLDYPIAINADDLALSIQFTEDALQGLCQSGGQPLVTFSGNKNDLKIDSSPNPQPLASFKSYNFQRGVNLRLMDTSTLIPPLGDNLASLIISSAKLRSVAEQVLAPFQLHLFLRPLENVEIIRYEQDVVVALPYELLSDTLQRVIFYAAAILHSKDSVIILEEPDAHAFPYYTKYLAELVALDGGGNQFFISTHNPYFLLPIMEKTPVNELAVFITYTRHFETRVRQLRPDELAMSEELDIFGNLDHFIEDGV